MKKAILVLSFFVILTTGRSQTVTLQNVISGPGSVPVNINMTGFSNSVGSFQFTIRYDTGYLHYNNTSNWAVGVGGVAINHNYYGAPPNVIDALTFVWGDTPVAVNGVLCTLNFTYSGGTCASLNFSDNPTPRGVWDENDPYTVTWNSGQVCPCTAVSVTGHPSNQSMCATTGSANFSVTASGTAPITYQWQYYNGSTWNNVVYNTPAGAVYANVATSTLTVTGITTANNYQYRCYLTNCSNANNATSNAATLTVNRPTAPTIGTITQPTCAVATGSVVLNGLPSSGTWTLTRTPGGIITTGTGTSTTINGLAAGTTYTYTVTDGVSGCVSVSSGNIVINAQPSPPATPTASVTVQPTCSVPTGTIIITAPTGAQYEYQLDAGTYQASATFTGVAVGDHTVKARLAASPTCVSSASSTMTVNAVPTVPATPTASVTIQPTCAVPTGTIVITAPTGAQYEYQLDAGTYQASTTFTGVAAGNHTVKARLTASPTCISSSSSSMTVNAAPAVPATPTASVTVQPTCATPTGTIVITAPLGAQYEYQLDAGTYQASATFTGVAVGNHTVKARLAASPTCISSASSSMTVNAVPTVPATPTASVTVQPTCAVPTGTIVITAPTGAQYEYQLDAGTYQASTTFTGVAVGNHTVNARLIASPTCVSPASSTMTVNAVPTVPATPTASVTVQPTCAVSTGTIVITAPTGAQYEYQLDAGTYQASATFTGVAAGNHTVKARLAASPTCISSASSSMTVNSQPSPPAAATASTTVQPSCTVATGTIVITAPLGAYQYNIDGGTYQASTTFTGVAAGSHNILVRSTADNTCISSVTAVTVNAQPETPSVTNQTTSILSGATFTVTPSGVPIGTTYTWIAPTYTGGVTGGSAQPTPQANISGTLTIPSGTGTAVYTVTPTSGTCVGATFTVTVTVSSSCTPVGISTNPLSQTKCEGQSVTFSVAVTGTSPYTYKWQKQSGTWANITGAPNSDIYTKTGLVAGDAGNYRCVVYNCGNADSAISNTAVLTVNPTPAQPSAISGTTTPCVGATINYSVTNVAGVNYQWTLPSGWSGTSTTNSINATVGSTAGQITVTPYANTGGCAGTPSTLNVTPNNLAANAGLDQTINSGLTANLLGNATGGTFSYNYSWAPTIMINGNPNQQMVTTVTLTSAQQYTLTVNDGVCTKTDQMWVYISGSLLEINDIMVDDDTICLGDSIHLDLNVSGGVPPYTFTWAGAGLSSTSIQNPAALPGVLGPNTYSVTVTDGITTLDTSITIFVSGSPAADAGQNKIIGCGIPFTTIGTTAVAGNTYNWLPATGLNNAGIAEPTAMPSATTIYTLTVTNTAGCVATDAAEVTLISFITVDAGADTTICSGSEYPLEAISQYALIYSWSPVTGLDNANISNPVASPIETTAYTITATAGSCSATDSILITVSTIPLTLSYDCDTYTATALPAGLESYEFLLNSSIVQTVGTANSFNATSIINTDIITVNASNQNGCIETVLLTVNCNSELPNAFTPDGDGINDVFGRNYELKVFDRWGLQLYTGQDGWDGTYRGKMMSPATYFYKVTITNSDGSKTEKTGAVTLVKN